LRQPFGSATIRDYAPAGHTVKLRPGCHAPCPCRAAKDLAIQDTAASDWQVKLRLGAGDSAHKDSARKLRWTRVRALTLMCAQLAAVPAMARSRYFARASRVARERIVSRGDSAVSQTCPPPHPPCVDGRQDGVLERRPRPSSACAVTCPRHLAPDPRPGGMCASSILFGVRRETRRRRRRALVAGRWEEMPSTESGLFNTRWPGFARKCPIVTRSDGKAALFGAV